MNRNRIMTRKMAESAIMIAASVMLSFVKIYEAPLGGSVTLFSMVPLMIVSMRHGIGWGLGSSFVFSVIKLWLGAGNFAYVPTAFGVAVTIVCDYLLAYSAIGLAGIFRNLLIVKNKGRVNMLINAYMGVMVACAVRFVCHFVNGAVVWYEITKNGDWNEYVHTVGMWVYSFIYNISYLGPEILITLLAVPVIVMALDIMKRTTKY